MEIIKIDSIDGVMLEIAIHNARQDSSRGCIIVAHGITASMDAGILLRLADRLTNDGFNVIRFSYRGHGKSGGTQRGMTIAGEVLDLQTVIDFASVRFKQPTAIIAASFGAVSTCLLIPYMKGSICGISLWNPVLDLKRTFIHPELPWGKKYFNHENIIKLISDGFILLNGSFEFGQVLWEEMKWYEPYRYFLKSSISSMIVHGDRDMCISYDIAREAAQKSQHCDFYTIAGSDHGFGERKAEEEVIDITVSWLIKLFEKDNPDK